jgi:hypothetical protein
MNNNFFIFSRLNVDVIKVSTIEESLFLIVKVYLNIHGFFEIEG